MHAVLADDLATLEELFLYLLPQVVAKPERISRLEIAKVLRERNEWKEKYFSLLEQVR